MVRSRASPGRPAPCPESRMNRGRQANLRFGVLNCGYRVAQRNAQSQIERKGHRRKLSLVGNGQRRFGGFEMGERAEGDCFAGGRADVEIVSVCRDFAGTSGRLSMIT